MLALVLALLAPLQGLAASPEDLVQALEALRQGEPGEEAFERALPRLPELIASDAADLVAGGAYLAAQHDRRTCLPALLATFERWDGLGAKARAHVLDALIRLGAQVEPGRLPLTPWLEVESYVLLARDPHAHRDELLRLFDACEEDAPERWACAVSLAHVDEAQLAARLLDGLPWTIAVQVREPGSFVGRSGGRRSMGIQCGRPAWPPRFAYALRLPEEDEPLSAQVPARRLETTGSCLRLDRSFDGERREALRRRLLAKLLDEDTLDLAADLDLEWHGDAAFVAALREHLPRQRAAFEEVARELAARGLLAGPAEALARTRFQIELFDMRDDKASGLPEPWLGADVVYVD